jgi:SnoaL-like domain
MAPPRNAKQLIEKAYRAWNSSGPRAFVEFTTENVELHDARELPDAQQWLGRDALVSRLEDVVAATGGRWADVDDIRPVADEIVVSLTWRLDQASPTLAAVYHVVGVEGDRIARIRVFLDEGAALHAALGARGAQGEA